MTPLPSNFATQGPRPYFNIGERPPLDRRGLQAGRTKSGFEAADPY